MSNYDYFDYRKLGANGFMQSSRQRTTVDTPGWMLSQGRLRENPYYLKVDDRLDFPVDVRHKRFNQIVLPTGSLDIQQANYDVVRTPQYIDVFPRLLEQWRQSQFNIGVSILEGRESARLIGGTLLQLGRAARDVKRGNLRGALGNLRRVPARNKALARAHLQKRNLVGTWLELRYGWRPLLSDIRNATEAIKLEGHKGIIRGSSIETGGYSSTGGYFRDEEDIFVVNRKRLHIKVEVSHTPSEWERFGLTDPLSIAWEVVPFSFVVDWFIPIQSTLLSLHAVRAMPVTSCTISRVTEQTRRGLVREGRPWGFRDAWETTSDAPYYDDFFEFTRTVRPDLPGVLELLPGVPRSLNSIWDLDFLTMVDGAALLMQTLSGFTTRGR